MEEPEKDRRIRNYEFTIPEKTGILPVENSILVGNMQARVIYLFPNHKPEFYAQIHPETRPELRIPIFRGEKEFGKDYSYPVKMGLALEHVVKELKDVRFFPSGKVYKRSSPSAFIHESHPKTKMDWAILLDDSPGLYGWFVGDRPSCQGIEICEMKGGYSLTHEFEFSKDKYLVSLDLVFPYGPKRRKIEAESPVIWGLYQQLKRKYKDFKKT